MNFLCMLNADLNNLETVYDYHHINITVDVNGDLRKRLRGMPYFGSIPGNISALDGRGIPPVNLEDISFYIDGMGCVTQTEDRFVEIGMRIYPEAIGKLKEVGKTYNGRTVLVVSLNLEERPSGTEGITMLAVGSATISKEGQDDPIGSEPIQIDLTKEE